jgi:hypothetical protein
MISATVTLKMSQWNFTRANNTQAFIRAVAAAAGVGAGEVNIVTVVEAPGGGGRRLLSAGGARRPLAGRAEVRVQLQVRNAVALASLDARLRREGLPPSEAHSHAEGHAVDVRRARVGRFF